MKRVYALAGLTLALQAPAALAYGAAGHQQICAIALQLTSESTRQTIQALMQQGPVTDFATGCSWPDEIRSVPGYQFTKGHHFVNVSRASKTLQAKDCPANGCLLSALNHHAAMLTSGALPRQKAQSLLFFSHFVADLHQPLHVSYADDQGGNKTALYFFKKPANLHGVWDRQLPEAFGVTAAADPVQLRQRISDLQRQQWSTGSYLQWGQQSLQLTRLIYRHYKPGMLYSDTELNRDKPLAEQRLLQAAVRLSVSLDQLLQTADSAAN